jgi:beta-xylosidase
MMASAAHDSTNAFLADPAVFAEGGTHYLYGTVEGASGTGFLTYTSKNLKDWKRSEAANGYALRKGEAFGTSGFWAPQVFRQGAKYYMAYVANEAIAIAQSNNPSGPFTQIKKDPLVAPVKQIDPFVFIDDDGKKYLYHVRLTGGNKIFVAALEDDFSAIKPETLRECITATDAWESTAKTDWPVTEGPSVLKHKDVYYLFYTANDFRNPDYAVGYATSNNPLGPWKKYKGNPIIHKNLIGWNGTGHGDFFKSGKFLYYVFHTHYSSSKVGPRRTALIKVKFVKSDEGIDKVKIETKSFRFLHKQQQ